MREDGYLTGGGRVAWAEALKGIGIYAIVLGHFGELAGDFYHIVFCFHVQLFFFAAGLFASRYDALTPREYLLKKGRSLGVPYLVFGLANLAFFTLYEGSGIGGVAEKLRQLLFGVRNDLFCANLWFLPAMFFAGLIYYLAKKLLKNKYAALGLCFALSAAFRIFKEDPSWWFGVDSGCRFAFWYALGDCAFKPLDALSRADSDDLSARAKWGLAAATLLSVGVAGAAWPGVRWLSELIGFDMSINAEKAWRFVIALAFIWLCALLAFALKRVPSLTRLGGRTLAVCCAEQAVRVTLIQIITLFGLSIRLTNQIQTLLYAALVTFLCSSVIGAFLAKYFPAAVGRRRE